jgi:hypothetical protein
MKRVKVLFAVILFSASALFAGGDQVIKSFKVSKGGTLKLDLQKADIILSTWDRNEVSVKFDGLDNEDSNQFNVNQSGNIISFQSSSSCGWSGGCDVKVLIPKEFNLDIKTNQGDVAITSDIKGWLNVYTGGGDIAIKNVAGNSGLKTNGGDVNTGNIYGDLLVDSKGGDIILGSVNGKANIVTLGGDVVLGNVEKDLTLKTNGGDIETGEIGSNASVTTLGGSINIKKISGNAWVSTNGGNIKLSGANGSIKVKTLGGEIYLYNISGTVSAYTNAGDVYVELRSIGSGTSSISSLSGTIKLLVEPNIKASIEASILDFGSDDENSISSDFPSESFNKYSGNVKALYQLNGGGSRITINTKSGDIQIKKLRK